MTRRTLLASLALSGLATAAAAQPAPNGVGQVPPAIPTPSPGQSPQSLSPPDTWLPRGTAELILLDKLRPQPMPLTIKVGDHASFGTLVIAVKGCQTRPPDLPQNAAVFLDITDSRGSAAVFRGWVLSNTPAVSQFEHPVYDLRLVACR